MMQNIRDISISILAFNIFCFTLWARWDPETVGYWEARRDVAYDQIMSEYAADCDCTEEYVE